MSAIAASLFDIISGIPQLLIVDVGASLIDGNPSPSYSSLAASGNAKVIGFEPKSV